MFLPGWSLPGRITPPTSARKTTSLAPLLNQWLRVLISVESASIATARVYSEGGSLLLYTSQDFSALGTQISSSGTAGLRVYYVRDVDQLATCSNGVAGVSSQTIATDQGQCTSNFQAPASCIPGMTYTCDVPSALPLGTHNLVCTGSDTASSETYSFEVTVQDQELSCQRTVRLPVGELVSSGKHDGGVRCP